MSEQFHAVQTTTATNATKVAYPSEDSIPPPQDATVEEWINYRARLEAYSKSTFNVYEKTPILQGELFWCDWSTMFCETGIKNLRESSRTSWRALLMKKGVHVNHGKGIRCADALIDLLTVEEFVPCPLGTTVEDLHEDLNEATNELATVEVSEADTVHGITIHTERTDRVSAMHEDINEATHGHSTLEDSEVDISQYHSPRAEPEEAIATNMAEGCTKHTSCVKYQMAQLHSGTVTSCVTNFPLWIHRIATPQPPDPGIARTLARYAHSCFEVIKTRYDGNNISLSATVRQPSIKKPPAQLMQGVAYCAVDYVISYPQDRRTFVLHKLNADENADPYSTCSDFTQQAETSGVGSYVLARKLMAVDESCATVALLMPFDPGITEVHKLCEHYPLTSSLTKFDPGATRPSPNCASYIWIPS